MFNLYPGSKSLLSMLSNEQCSQELPTASLFMSVFEASVGLEALGCMHLLVGLDARDERT